MDINDQQGEYDDEAFIAALPILLSTNADYVDTAGYLALQGLFTAHVTGNFVTLGASLVFGTSGRLTKLLALPTFCVVIIVTRWVSYGFKARRLPILRTMLTLQVALLAATALAVRFGPFSNSDSLPALATGLTLVSAMAIQNAAQRIHLGSSPPTTLMTGTTTQVMIDAADKACRPTRKAPREPGSPKYIGNGDFRWHMNFALCLVAIFIEPILSCLASHFLKIVFRRFQSTHLLPCSNSGAPLVFEIDLFL